jgi:16S rRNA (guanine966-N2)-methyltransferase
MRVIAGKLKGRNISFVNKKFNNAETTTQMVKEALFSILGNDLTNASFLDLYACSGQIGFEAFSRNAGLVVMNDFDNKRFCFIKSTADAWNIQDKLTIMNLKAFSCIRLLHSKNTRFDYIYLDPPYEKEKGRKGYYEKILNEIEENDITKDNSIIIIQHFGKSNLPSEAGKFRLDDSRKYGSNSLSFYR